MARKQVAKRSTSQAKATTGKGVVRIIGGNMRGRKLTFEDSEGLRPTLDRVRETLFNWLARDIAGSNCLDLFAGSGALGFEAISRGAADVTMVEKNAKACIALKKNGQLLEAENIHLVSQAAEDFLAKNTKKFDIVFLDPPFGKAMLADTLKALKPHLAEDALVYIEQEKSANEFIPDDNWAQLKYKKTSSFSYALYCLADK